MIKSTEVEEELKTKGFSVGAVNRPGCIPELKELYNSLHSLNTRESGGSFWSIYSRNEKYKREVHENIQRILKPLLDSLFEDYKCAICSFVVKLTGGNSYLHTHRDLSSMDETKYAPLSLWLPLQDVNAHNGPVYFLPGSHAGAYPYRSLNAPVFEEGLEPVCWNYGVPAYLKQGEMVLFDPRTLHFSPPNFSNETRIAVVCSIFPEAADLQLSYYNADEASMEVYSFADDFMITYPHFLSYPPVKPEGGTLVKKVPFYPTYLNAALLEEWCKEQGLKPTGFVPSNTDAFPVAEPVV